MSRSDVVEQMFKIVKESILLFFEGTYKDNISKIYENVLLAKQEQVFKRELFFLAYILTIEAIAESKYGDTELGVEAKNKLEEHVIEDLYHNFFKDDGVASLIQTLNTKIENWISTYKQHNGEKAVSIVKLIKALNTEIGVEIPIKDTLVLAQICNAIQHKTIENINDI